MIDSGFTMIELIVVIAIVGILATATIPMIGNFSSGQSLDQLSQSVNRAIQSATMKTKSQRDEIRVKIDFFEEKMSFSTCSKGVGCRGWYDSEWDSDKDLSILSAESPNHFYKVGLGTDFAQEYGDAEVIICPNGTDSDNCSDRFTAIHLTSYEGSPPAEDQRCKFRTIIVQHKFNTVTSYDYGRYNPFPEDSASC